MRGIFWLSAHCVVRSTRCAFSDYRGRASARPWPRRVRGLFAASQGPGEPSKPNPKPKPGGARSDPERRPKAAEAPRRVEEEGPEAKPRSREARRAEPGGKRGNRAATRSGARRAHRGAAEDGDSQGRPKEGARRQRRPRQRTSEEPPEAAHNQGGRRGARGRTPPPTTGPAQRPKGRGSEGGHDPSGDGGRPGNRRAAVGGRSRARRPGRPKRGAYRRTPPTEARGQRRGEWGRKAAPEQAARSHNGNAATTAGDTTKSGATAPQEPAENNSSRGFVLSFCTKCV